MITEITGALSDIFGPSLGTWTLRIIGATFASLTGHFLLDFTINPKWYKWQHAFLVCFILSMFFAWLDGTGSNWRQILSSGLVCSGASMFLFFMGHKWGPIVMRWKFKKK